MNYNKVIKDLKERNDKLESQRRQFELKLYHEQHIVEQKDEEIQRLNNIIEELEKSWKEQQEYYRYRKDNRYRTFLSKNLDKLKELKEGKE